MNYIIQIIIYVLIIFFGSAAVLTKNPLKQSMVLSLYGILLSILFLILQAPEVALSEIVIGVIAVPLMILLTLAKVKSFSLKQNKKK